MFELGEKLLESMFDASPLEITYKRGASAIVQGIKAKKGERLFRVIDNNGYSYVYKSHDFIIRQSDIGNKPEAGDIIEYGGKSFRVSGPPGEPCWEWHSRRSERFLRVHTAEV